MNELTVFNNNEFGNIRTLNMNGDPWFVGKDVAEKLGYLNSRKAIIDHVDKEDKTDGVTIRDALGREQNPILINESGLYSLILSSKLPSAKAFKRWIISEVIPAIRKTGSYSTVNEHREIAIDADLLREIVGLTVSETMKQVFPYIQAKRDNPIRQRRTPETKPFSEIIDSVMKKNKMNPDKMAKKLSVSPATIHNWKHGKTNPSASNMMNFVQIFNLNSGDFEIGVF